MNDFDLPYGAITTTADGNFYTVTSTGVPVPICNTSSAPQKIQGKMLTTKCEITQSLWEDSDKDAIKHKMIHGIVEEMIKSKCIEFTSLQAPNNDYVTITARVFVTSDDQVQLLRKAGY